MHLSHLAKYTNLRVIKVINSDLKTLSCHHHKVRHKKEAHQLQGKESPAAAKAKVVRRLSFSSSSGENDAKKLKTSGGSARESKKATRKPPKSKSGKMPPSRLSIPPHCDGAATGISTS